MGPSRRAAGIEDDVVLAVADPTLGGVLAAIAKRFPEAGRRLQPAPGTIEPAVRVVLNDVVLPAASVAQAVKDGDRVAFVPVVGGGGEAASGPWRRVVGERRHTSEWRYDAGVVDLSRGVRTCSHGLRASRAAPWWGIAPGCFSLHRAP